MSERRLRVKLVTEPDKTPLVCGLTKVDEKKISHMRSMVDNLHAMCAERVGSALQVKPAATFNIEEACELRDVIIKAVQSEIDEMIRKAETKCPRLFF